MAIHLLKDQEIKSIKTKARLDDGGGLRLNVSKNLSKSWTFRYTFNGKRHEIGLGIYPDISLADARDISTKYRSLVNSRIDPKSWLKEKDKTTPTFKTIAATHIKSYRKGWKNTKHARQWPRTLKTYACPVIGHKPIDTIDTKDILEILKPIWETKTDTAKRLQSRIENIFDSAAAHGYLENQNPARWKGHLDKLLPKPNSLKKVNHHSAMPYSEISDFYNLLEKKNGYSSLALRLLILTACRTNEIIGAKWSEFDLDNKIWTIPAERMKSRKEHRVPLSNESINLLKNIPINNNTEFLFPGNKKGKPISNASMLKVMRSLISYDYVVHGFRSSFRDWAAEQTSHSHDVIEMSLAHAIKNKTEAAYRRSDLLEKRRLLMQEWAGSICGQQSKIICFLKAS